MVNQINVGGVPIDIIFKDIKNLHLSVHPPTGRVRIAAPSRTKLETIRVYAITKINWIKKHQQKLQEQERESPYEYVDRESHYVWGRRYLLKVNESNQLSSVKVQHKQLVLTIRPKNNVQKMDSVLSTWYREEVKALASSLIAKWEPIMGVTVGELRIRKMKTKWGSCKPQKKSILLNSDLGKKPRACLEYIVVHEMAHLLEPTHNTHFFALMDKFMPQWKYYKDQLNKLPVRHEEWKY
ncbi:MAG: M48 family metallopeptidase [Anaerolineales bacterium]|nr:M48 family metallopeptidase [Anaerolineales bacterium]